MYFDNTYDHYLESLHTKWLALVKEKEKCGVPFKNIIIRCEEQYTPWVVEIILVNSHGDYLVSFHHEPFREDKIYAWDHRSVQVIKRDIYRIDNSDYRPVSFETEVRALLLLAFAFADPEDIKILKFFLQVATEPEIEYAYIMSERYPAPVKEIKAKEKPVKRVVTLPYHERNKTGLF